MTLKFSESVKYHKHEGPVPNYQFGTADLVRKCIGKVSFSDGRVIACDPSEAYDDEPFVQTVPPGEYPIYLSILNMGGDQRVAFASLQIRSDPITVYEVAITKSTPDDLTRIDGENVFGYPVDSGTGCFASTESYSELLAFAKEMNDLGQELLNIFEENYVDTWSWFVGPLGNGKSNIAMFSAGWGDGRYPTVIGRNQAGEIVAIVTDFGLIKLDVDPAA